MTAAPDPGVFWFFWLCAPFPLLPFRSVVSEAYRMLAGRPKSTRLTTRVVSLRKSTRRNKSEAPKRQKSPRLVASTPEILKIRIPSAKKERLVADSECPVCGSIISGDAQDVQEHVNHCLGSSGESDDFELPMGRFDIPDALPASVTLNIEEGDESRYGRPQYTLTDIKRILRDSSSDAPEAVKEEGSCRCMVCLEEGYRRPVVSVGCWHVCCEVCWCGILEAKRLCPQCNRITSPDDLRRIYL